MGKQGFNGDRFRCNVKAERERRQWSQAGLAGMLADRGYPMHWTTIAKIEAGDRSVRVDEAGVFADLFGVSVDTMIGRTGSDTDMVWAIGKLSSSAHKIISELASLEGRLFDDLGDVVHYAERDGKLRSVEPLRSATQRARVALADAQESLSVLADSLSLSGQ